MEIQMEGTQIEQAEIFTKDGEQITGITEEAAGKLKEAGFDENAIEKMSYEEVETHLTAKPEEYEITKEQAEELNKLGFSDKEIEAMTEEDVTAALEGGPEPSVITEDMAKQFPFAKSMVGKPVSDLLKVLDNQNKYINELQRKQSQPTKQTENENTEIEYPDPIDDPAGYAKAIKQSILDGLKEIIPKQETRQPSQADIHKEIKQYLPEGIDPKKAIDAWQAEEGNYLPDSMKEAYMQNPNILFKHIGDYARTNMKPESTQPSKAKQVKDALKHRNKEDNKYNAVPRKQVMSEGDQYVQSMAEKIINRNAWRYKSPK